MSIETLGYQKFSIPFLYNLSLLSLQTGVSIKAGYRQSTVACRTSYCRLFGFHCMKIKMIIKKANSITTTTTETFKCFKNCMLFDAQNAGNRISELLDFKFFWGTCPQNPLGERGLAAPLGVTAAYYTFSGHL